MSVNIRHSVTPIRQPVGSSLCWAAAISMLLGDGLTVEQVVQQAVSAGRRVNQDGSLPDRSPEGIRWTAATFRLRCADVRNQELTVPLLAGFLRPGRIAILGSFSYVGSGGAATLHAICGYSLVGGGGGENTRLGYVDPFRRTMDDGILNELLDNLITDPHFIFHR